MKAPGKMSPMVEVTDVYQRPGELRRRWFENTFFDLITWMDEGGAITSFQLCYDKLGRERAICWQAGQGLFNARIDAGETGPLKNLAPVVQPGHRETNRRQVRQLFIDCSANIDPAIRRFVLHKLEEESA